MRRLIVVAATALAVGAGGFAVAQEATPPTNAPGTPCPSPAATPAAPLAGTPLPSPVLAPEALASPVATPMASPAATAGCPAQEGGAPTR